jgi:hypothetical protein
MLNIVYIWLSVVLSLMHFILFFSVVSPLGDAGR